MTATETSQLSLGETGDSAGAATGNRVVLIVPRSHRVPGKDPVGNGRARRMIVDNRIPLIVHLVVFPSSSVVERPAVNRIVVGSNPTWGAKFLEGTARGANWF